MKYSVVIPTYGRNDFLVGCLQSIEKQTIKPEDVYVIDNNDNHDYQKSVQEIVHKCSSDKVKFTYKKGLINSGAVARNYGASLVTTELVAFLDDDVVVDIDYYEKIIDIFKTNQSAVGIQGIDRALIESFRINVQEKFMGRIFLAIENFFEHTSITRKKNAEVSPSLAVMHPLPSSDFQVESQWISTCAGVFKKDIFNSIEFPKHFVKYSWNEYVFFSYSIYKKNLGKMIYSSIPKYRNIPTDAGRLPLKDLVYMSEVYDLYIFSELFNRNISDKIIFIKSRIGRFLFYFARMIKRRNFDFGLLKNVIGGFYFAYSNRKEIKKGNLKCYNDKFPLD